MRLCLHGERAEAHKEQVKDVSVSNVRQHKKGEGEETNPCSNPRWEVRQKIAQRLSTSRWYPGSPNEQPRTLSSWPNRDNVFSMAKVGRQEGCCPMDCRPKTRDGHYQLALGAMWSSLYLNQWTTTGSCTRQLPLSALMRRGLVSLSAALVVRRIRSSLQHYLAPQRSHWFWSILHRPRMEKSHSDRPRTADM